MAAAQDIDIGDGCRAIEVDQENLPAGHSVQGTIDQNCITGNTLYFERTVDFRCHGIPTSFYFRVTLRSNHAGAINSVACVKRTDQGSGLVNVRLVTNVFQHGRCGLSMTHDFPGLGAGKVLRATSQDCILEDIEFAFNRHGNLRFDFVLTVQDCHVEQKRAEAMDTDTHDSEDSSPRKRLRVQSSS